MRLVIGGKRQIRPRGSVKGVCASDQKLSVAFSLAAAEFGYLSDCEVRHVTYLT